MVTEGFGKNIEHQTECKHDSRAVCPADGVTPQTVFKWEWGNSLPDISALPLLVNALHCNIDSLLGYAAEQQKTTDYEERYKVDGYYWGIQPSNMCYEVMKLCMPVKPLRLLDVACSEGKECRIFCEKRIQL